jgi:CO/xanthine dehydrogenase Mo-binding subunit
MNLIGAAVDRVDGPAKVTGRATYIGDVQLPRMTHAALVLSTIPNGRIVSLDTAAAAGLPGVLFVLTHANAPVLPDGGRAGVDPPSGRVLSLLQDERVFYDRQPIAVVVAESLEQATAAAARVTVRYAREPALLDFAAALSQAHSPGKINGEAADSAREGKTPEPAAQRVTEVYTTPIENHNPMEPHATIAAWSGENLTLYDTTQGIAGAQKTIAKTFGLSPDNVHVICPYVGGGFGCKGSVWSHVALTVMAARLVGRPVKLVLERPQMFGPVGARPRTEQHLSVAATAAGKFTEIRHDVFSHTSRIEDFAEPAALQTRLLYACPNVSTSHRVVPLNVGTPTFQRAPGHSTGTYALGCALDELAIALSIDPIEMRRRNEPLADRVLHGRSGGFRLGAALAAAALDARRQSTARLGLRHRDLSGEALRGQGARRNHGRRPRRRQFRDPGPRYGHVHGHDTDRRPNPGLSAEPRTLRTRRQRATTRARFGWLAKRRERSAGRTSGSACVARQADRARGPGRGFAGLSSGGGRCRARGRQRRSAHRWPARADRRLARAQWR